MPEYKHLNDDKIFEIRLKYLEDRACLYRPFLRPRTVEVMNQAIFSESFAGATDVSALSLITTFCAICQPARVLELGTYYGFSTLILADILSSNQQPGRIVTVDCAEGPQGTARQQIELAGLTPFVQFVRGLSTEKAVLEAVHQSAPYDMIYIDTSHYYKATVEELETYLITHRVIRAEGLIFLHDITWDMGDDRGVGAAVADWLKLHPDFRYLPLTTRGVWPNPCGLGVMLAPPKFDQQIP